MQITPLSAYKAKIKWGIQNVEHPEDSKNFKNTKFGILKTLFLPNF